MSTRIHTANPRHVFVRYMQNPAEHFKDDEMDVGPALVLEDIAADEAFVLVGTPEQIDAFTKRIIQALGTPTVNHWWPATD